MNSNLTKLIFAIWCVCHWKLGTGETVNHKPSHSFATVVTLNLGDDFIINSSLQLFCAEVAKFQDVQ